MSSEKKRKSHSGRAEDARPNKKPALESLLDLPPLKVRTIEDGSELAPVLVDTPGLELSRNLPPLTAYLKPRSTAKSTASGIDSTELLLQSSAHPKLDLIGREADDDADAQVKHYVAVVDPEQKTCEFVPVRRVTVRGGVRKAKRLEKGSDDGEDEVEDGTATTLREQRTALTNTFGTKVARKAAQSVAENARLATAPTQEAQAAEAAILASLPAESVSESAAHKAENLQATIQANKPVPRANTAAAHPADVYPLAELVPGGLSVLRQVPIPQDWQDASRRGKSLTNSSSRFVARRVDKVVRSGDTTQMQLLRFIQLLLDLTRALRRGNPTDARGTRRLPPRDDLRRILSSSSSNNNTPIPDAILDAVRRRFCSAGNGAALSLVDQTLLHTTICALSLHIPPSMHEASTASDSSGGNAANELATDPSDLRDDLRLDNTKILQYFRELGCRVDKPRETEYAKFGIKGGKVEAAASRVVRLRVPVEFPKVRKR